jgi:hypothetical protein
VAAVPAIQAEAGLSPEPRNLRLVWANIVRKSQKRKKEKKDDQ